MNEENDFMYDDEEAVKFIKNYLPQELKDKFNDDNIVYIVDLIYKFYESKGFLDGSDDLSVEIDEDELIQYVIKNIRKDGIVAFTQEEITFVVEGELAYCDSINIFE